MNICTHKGTPTVAFGIMDMRNYSEKEIIQKASYYWSGIQYEKCKGCMFHSGDYYLEPFTEELSEQATSARAKAAVVITLFIINPLLVNSFSFFKKFFD